MNDHLTELAVGASERFYMLAHPDLTIYGHTIDRWIMRTHPEDVERIRELRGRGREFGCWHSRWCPEGEKGSNDVRLLRRISREEYELAAGRGWPKAEAITTDQPAIRISAQDEQGNWKTIYESTEGSTDLATGPSEGQQDRAGGAAEDGGGEEPPEVADHPAEVP